MASVFLLHHVYDLDGIDELKLIGVYSSRAKAEIARDRLAIQPGFVDHPDCFEISEYEIDRDGWTEGFLTTVHVEVPLRDSSETVTAQASRLSLGYELWPEPDVPTERWLFQPGQIVRCEVRDWLDGTTRLVAVEALSG